MRQNIPDNNLDIVIKAQQIIDRYARVKLKHENRTLTDKLLWLSAGIVSALTLLLYFLIGGS